MNAESSEIWNLSKSLNKIHIKILIEENSYKNHIKIINISNSFVKEIYISI